MRFAATALTICAAFLVSSAQDGKTLPGELQPDPTSIEKAREMEAEAFKLLPRGMFSEPFNSYSDADNAIGIRGGGAYYSFSKRSHSYNHIPQLGLEQGYITAARFYGANLGFLFDLGKRELGSIEPSAELDFLLNYTPPSREAEVRAENDRFRNRKDEAAFRYRLPAVEGHSYLLRAISFGEADKLVAIHIFKKYDDGSLAIIWKTIKDFRIPKIVRKVDEDLAEKVKNVLSELNADEVRFTVEHEIVKLTGACDPLRYKMLIERISALNPRAIMDEVKKK